MRSSYLDRDLNIAAGEIVALPIKPPFTVQVKPARSRALPGDSVKFDLAVADAGGQTFTAPRSSISPAKNPRFTLAAADGKIIGTYTMQYG